MRCLPCYVLYSYLQDSTKYTWMLRWLHLGPWQGQLRWYVVCFFLNACFIWLFAIILYTFNSCIVVLECSPGYTGPECSTKCPVPLYGNNCQKICTCSPMEFCDFVSGCLRSKYMSEVRKSWWEIDWWILLGF